MEKSLLEDLLQKYLTGNANEEETDQLLRWYSSFNDETVTVPLQDGEEEKDVYERLKSKIGSSTGAGLTEANTKAARRPVPYKFAAAAAVLVLMAVGGWRWFRTKENAVPAGNSVVQKRPGKILPGHNGAVLTLADGTKVMLDSSSNGQIGVQGTSKIVKEGSSVTYASAATAGNSAAAYNTMSTPAGREFKIVLPDGTKAWLNAASSVTYPVVFGDSGRTVSVTGEVYFEVAKLSDKNGKRVPFTVESDRMSIKVLGTHFDIEAYTGEQNYKVALFEGSVEVSGPGGNSDKVRIVPGQGARMAMGNAHPEVYEADLDKVAAWRNDMFQFDDDRLDDIMRQIARWYDVDVSCTEEKRKLRFNGVISKRADVSDILHLLSVTGVVNFKIDGRKIYAY